MEYSSPKVLEMAIKEAAKASPLDTNRAIAERFASCRRAERRSDVRS